MRVTRLALIVLMALGAAILLRSPTTAKDNAPGFTGNAQCKLCHDKESEGAQWSVWSKTAHANAFQTLKGESAVNLAKSLGLSLPPAEAPECLRCHVTSYDTKTKEIQKEIIWEDGIQCESCHGAAEGHRAYAFALARLKDKEQVTLPVVVVRPGNEDCLKCHNAESPTWDPARYTLKDGTEAGFDFRQAFKKIAHWNPKG